MITVHTQEELDGITGAILCKFGAAWCTPCRDIDEQLEKLEAKFKQICTFVSVDVDAAEALCVQHGIKKIPHVKITLNKHELFNAVNPSHDAIQNALQTLQSPVQ